MSRATVRGGIASYFGGTDFDAEDRIWRNGPLLPYGLGGVRAYFPKRFPDSDFTMGMLPGRAMGALMVVHLAQASERRIALGGAISGEKRVTYNVTLHVYHYAQQPHTEDAQADLDALLEATVDHIHDDRTLGGAVVEAGEGATLTGITTRMDVPVVNSERTESYAVVAFDANTYISA